MNTSVLEKSHRVKVNFMVESTLLKQIKTFVPEGERSDFANEAFEEALVHFRLKKMSEGIDALRKKNKTYISTKEIIRLRDEGRK